MKLHRESVLALTDYSLLIVFAQINGGYRRLGVFEESQEEELAKALGQHRLVAVLTHDGDEAVLHLDKEFGRDRSLDQILSKAERELESVIRDQEMEPGDDPYA